MSGRNSTLVKYPRSSISPELWIPYVMIGVSCVTFLAVHFWCYHKRNRERYLRKRDEKRVKSGLIERRRITTLMVARYQSELGISQSDSNLHLNQDALFYDNCADVVLNEGEGENPVASIQKSYTYQILNEGSKLAPSAAAASLTGAVPKQSKDGPKPISASRTWPVVSERRCVSHNAHTGPCHKEINTVSAIDSEKTNAIDYNFNSDSHPLRMTENGCEYDGHTEAIKQPMNDKDDLETERRERIWDSFPGTSTESDSSSRSFLPTKPHISSAHVHRDPPPSYPSVFYTRLNSPYAIKSALNSDYKSNQTKGRHGGDLVADGAICQQSFQDHSIDNKTGEIETSFNENGADSSPPYPISGTRDTNVNNDTQKTKDYKSKYISSDTGAQNALATSDNSECPRRNDDTTVSINDESDDYYPYGSNDKDTERAKTSRIYSPVIQDNPLNTSEKNNRRSQQYSAPISGRNYEDDSNIIHQSLDTVDSGRQNNQTLAKSDNVQHPEYSRNTVSNTGRKVHASDPYTTESKYHQATTNPCPRKGHGVQQNVVIALHERPRPGLLSKNPEKFKGTLQGNEGAKSWFSRSRFGTLNRVDTFDHSDTVARSDSQFLKDTATSSIPVPQLPPSYDACVTNTGSGVSSFSEMQASGGQSGTRSEVQGDSKNWPIRKPIDGAISSQPLQTPPLRGLDPNIVFEHTKRKSGVKSE